MLDRKSTVKGILAQPSARGTPSTLVVGYRIVKQQSQVLVVVN
jgi:hypothetical protein